jgi:hypothetical protein
MRYAKRRVVLGSPRAVYRCSIFCLRLLSQRLAPSRDATIRLRIDTRCRKSDDTKGVLLMTIARIANPTLKAAGDALQSGNRQEWAALFEPDAELCDDGRPRSLESFTRDALGHEHFVSIDRVGNHSLELIGHFHSDKWENLGRTSSFSYHPAGESDDWTLA